MHFYRIGFKVCCLKFLTLNSLDWICVSTVLSNLFRIFIKKETKQRLSCVRTRKILQNIRVLKLLSVGDQMAILKCGFSDVFSVQ